MRGGSSPPQRERVVPQRHRQRRTVAALHRVDVAALGQQAQPAEGEAVWCLPVPASGRRSSGACLRQRRAHLQRIDLVMWWPATKKTLPPSLPSTAAVRVKLEPQRQQRKRQRQHRATSAAVEEKRLRRQKRQRLRPVRQTEGKKKKKKKGAKKGAKGESEAWIKRSETENRISTLLVLARGVGREKSL